MRIRFFIISIVFFLITCSTSMATFHPRDGFYHIESSEKLGKICAMNLRLNKDGNLETHLKIYGPYTIRTFCNQRIGIHGNVYQKYFSGIREFECENYLSCLSKEFLMPFDLHRHSVSQGIQLDDWSNRSNIVRSKIFFTLPLEFTIELQYRNTKIENSKWTKLWEDRLVFAYEKIVESYIYEWVASSDDHKLSQDKNCKNAELEAMNTVFEWCEQLYQDCTKVEGIKVQRATKSDACRATVKLKGQKPL